MNGHTFSPNPCKRGKSHHHHPSALCAVRRSLATEMLMVTGTVVGSNSDVPRMSPIHQVWLKPSCKAQWKGEEDKADRGRGGKTKSGNGQAWSSQSPRGQWRTGKDGGNWLRNHLWYPNDPCGHGIDDDDDDDCCYSCKMLKQMEVNHTTLTRLQRTLLCRRTFFPVSFIYFFSREMQRAG